MNWAQTQRMEFISRFTKKHGKINRADIMKAFGISVPQASLDLKAYRKLNPKTLKYNNKDKYYEWLKP